MYGIASHDALFLDELLECLEKLQMLHIGALRFDQFIDNVLALGALDVGRRGVGGAFVGRSIVDQTLLDQEVEHTVDNFDNLQAQSAQRKRERWRMG